MIHGVSTRIVVNNERLVPWFLFPFFFVLVGIRFVLTTLDRFIADVLDCIAIIPLEDPLPRQKKG